MTEKQAQKIIARYERGGSFDAALLKAVRCADEANLFELSKAFPFLVDAHLTITKRCSLMDWVDGVCAGKYGEYEYNAYLSIRRE